MEKHSTIANYAEAGSFAPSYSASAEPAATAESTSGVAWGAVIGGAFVAASISLIMLALGAGFGLSSVSPWSNVGASAATIGTVGIAWLIFTEIVACGLGGYLTGRLRTKWALIHNDEVYFRDTANGFLAWAVALVMTATFMTSAAASMVGSAAQADAAEGAGMAAQTEAYFVDTLFRSDRVGPDKDLTSQAEAARIFAHALPPNEIAPADRSYLARLIATNTGVSLPEAEKRISDVMTDARQTEDRARKLTAHLLLWIFLTLAIGAFTASYAATIGGRQRDHVKLA
jgi:hypothetical protein